MILALAFAAPAQAAEAQSAASTEHRLIWKDEWRRFDLVEYAATAAIVGAYYVVELEATKPSESNWSGGIVLDGAVRRPLVGSTATARNRAADFGDYLFLVPPAWAILDGIVTPLATDRGNLDVAWQVTAMNIQAVGLVGLLTRAGHRFIARERPDVSECEQDGEYNQVCFRGSFASFPSGHTSSAGVGAGLICAHHLNLPLYGGGAPDVLACSVNVGMTALIGYSRIVADRHYLSDVVVGAGLGFGVGFGLPVLLHYQSVGAGASDAGVSWAVAPYGTANGAGAQVVGGF
ncbi:MAG TPA: phosphatase PAP2 family protein [Polyangiaceae bacterium]|nr:phosphatase PAP2 family protein [Polyangiaceae bacterium]